MCVCGKKPKVKLITRKPLTASEEELAYFSKNFEELYASVQVDWIGGHSFGFVVEDVLPDYTDEPESELEDEDDLEL